MLALLLIGCHHDDEAPPLGDSFALVASDGAGPLDGAQALFVGGDGTEVAGESGDDGQIVVSGFAWDAGPAALTVVWSDYAWSLVELDESGLASRVGDDGALYVVFPGDSAGGGDSIRLTGSIANLPDGDAAYVALHPVGIADDATSGFAVNVPAGTAIDAIGFAWRVDAEAATSSWGFANVVDAIVVEPIEAASDDVEVTLDFSAEDRAQRFAHSIAAPESSWFGTTAGFVAPVAGDSGYSMQYGFPTLVDRIGDDVEFDGAFVELATVADPWMMYRFDGQAGYSALFVPGWPAATAALPHAFLTPPFITAGDPESTIEWSAAAADLADPGVAGTVALYSADDGGVHWVVTVPAGATELDLPPLPDGIELSDLIGGNPGIAMGWEGPDPADPGAFRTAWSNPVAAQ